MFGKSKPKSYRIGFEFTFLGGRWQAKLFSQLSTKDVPMAEQLALLELAAKQVAQELKDLNDRRN